MLKGPTKNVRNEEIGQLFTWNQSIDKPGFELRANSDSQFERVLAQFKKDVLTHQLGEGLFETDPAALTIKLTKANFIHWQKAILTSQMVGKK
ncbi:hypothetical protein [Candidatus Berkiella aquae]|uniref:Uncharacterized protein n=1 Tax=Candidatus Berkiella aquae TaxID=295108 RepID=A0A0Q9YY93_9GAMM|nr:hypothetical protein [Candidatus Berkiella aquae]MCS5710339.1 hypothetical protein [Candidatus Berkiella aquae]